MQTSNNHRRNASPQGLETRFQAVRSFFIDRNVRHYMSVFAAFGLDLDDQKDIITAWWNGRARITDADLPTLVKMEGVVECLKNETIAA